MYKSPGYSAEVKVLLDIINKRNSAAPSGINIEKLWLLAKLHDIAPLIFSELKKRKDYLPENSYSDLKYDYLSSLFRNSKFWGEFVIVNRELRQKNISFVPIKGIDMLARFYPGSGSRYMVDIDMLIKEDDFNQAQDSLLRLGYRRNLENFKEYYWKQKQYHIFFDKGPVRIEAHWSLGYKRGENIILPELWKRIKEIELDNHKIKILSDEDAFFAFAIHLRHFGNILALKQVLDVARIINESLTFDWDYVLKQSYKSKLRATVYFVLTQAKLFTVANIPEDFFKKLRLPRWHENLIKKFITTYTFQTRVSIKNNYLKAHLLLYDNLKEPVSYLLNIPHEQFCKFYDLKPYIFKTSLFYHLRFLYIPLKQLLR